MKSSSNRYRTSSMRESLRTGPSSIIGSNVIASQVSRPPLLFLCLAVLCLRWRERGGRVIFFFLKKNSLGKCFSKRFVLVTRQLRGKGQAFCFAVPAPLFTQWPLKRCAAHFSLFTTAVSSSTAPQNIFVSEREEEKKECNSLKVCNERKKERNKEEKALQYCFYIQIEWHAGKKT